MIRLYPRQIANLNFVAVNEEHASSQQLDDVEEFFGRAKVQLARNVDMEKSNAENHSSPETTSAIANQSNAYLFALIEVDSRSDSSLPAQHTLYGEELDNQSGIASGQSVDLAFADENKEIPRSPKQTRLESPSSVPSIRSPHDELNHSATLDIRDHLSNSENDNSRTSTPSLRLPPPSSDSEGRISPKEGLSLDPLSRTITIQSPIITIKPIAKIDNDDDDFPPEVVPRFNEPSKLQMPGTSTKTSLAKNNIQNFPTGQPKARLIPAGDRLPAATAAASPARKPAVPRFAQRHTTSNDLNKRSRDCRVDEIQGTVKKYETKAKQPTKHRPSRPRSVKSVQAKSRPTSTTKLIDEDQDGGRLQDQTNQEERYQLARRKAVERLKHWSDTKAATEAVNQQDSNNDVFVRSYTINRKEEVQKESKVDIRQRQRSVKVPQFSRRRASSKDHPREAKPNLKLRPSSSVTNRTRGRSSERPSTFPVVKQGLPDLIQKRLVDFPVNDSKHSPKTSYWLFQEAFPELFWLPASFEREELGSLLVDGALDNRQVKLDFFDRMLYSTSISGPSNMQRMQYDDRVRQNIRYQNIR